MCEREILRFLEKIRLKLLKALVIGYVKSRLENKIWTTPDLGKGLRAKEVCELSIQTVRNQRPCLDFSRVQAAKLE